MQTKHRIATLAGVTLAVTGTLGVALPQTALADVFNPCNLMAKASEIAGWDSNGTYNVIVWKESARGSIQLNGVVNQGHTEAQECNRAPESVNYFWAAFRDGEFTLRGDGGYKNWAFIGRFERNGNHVRFLPR